MYPYPNERLAKLQLAVLKLLRKHGKMYLAILREYFTDEVSRGEYVIDSFTMELVLETMVLSGVVRRDFDGKDPMYEVSK